MNISREYIYFIVARIVGLSVKPIFLLYLMNYNTAANMTMLALIYLLFAGVFIICNIPVHFEYYKLYFENKKPFLHLRTVFYKYLENLSIHIIIVLPFILIVINGLMHNLYISILLMIYFIFEKVFDEIQRFLQFKKNFISWSNIFLFKTLLPVLVTIINIETVNIYPIEGYILINIIVIFFIGVKKIPKFVLMKFYGNIYNLNYQKVKLYIFDLKNKYILKYFFGILSANVLNVDKWLATILYTKAILTELTLISQFGNAISTGMDYITITNRRSDLVKSDNNIYSLLYGIKIPLLSLLFFVIVLAILYFMESLTSGIKELNFISIIFILLSYTVYSISAPLSEFLFWNISPKVLLFIDLLFLLISIVFGIFLYYTNNYIEIPIYIFIGHLLRLTLLLLVVCKFNKMEKDK